MIELVKYITNRDLGHTDPSIATRMDASTFSARCGLELGGYRLAICETCMRGQYFEIVGFLTSVCGEKEEKLLLSVGVDL